MLIFDHVNQDTTVGLYYNNETYVKTELCLDANYETKGERLVFAWYQLLTMFLVPSIVMVYCYAVVIRVLWLSTKELAKMTHTKESYQYVKIKFYLFYMQYK